MTLQELRTYYRLREYQISHLLNAMEFHKLYCKGRDCDLQLWLYLFYWADAMYEADDLFSKIVSQSKTNVLRQSRGYA